MLTSDQEARVRFAGRLFREGLTFDAPESTVESAKKLCDKVVEALGSPGEITTEDFKRIAAKVIDNNEN